MAFRRFWPHFSPGFDLKILLLTATSATNENQKMRKYAIICNNMRSNFIQQKRLHYLMIMESLVYKSISTNGLLRLGGSTFFGVDTMLSNFALVACTFFNAAATASSVSFKDSAIY